MRVQRKKQAVEAVNSSSLDFDGYNNLLAQEKQVRKQLKKNHERLFRIVGNNNNDNAVCVKIIINLIVYST